MHVIIFSGDINGEIIVSIPCSMNTRVFFSLHRFHSRFTWAGRSYHDFMSGSRNKPFKRKESN